MAGLGYNIVMSHFDFDDKGKPDESAASKTKSAVVALRRRCEALRGDVGNADDRLRLVEVTRASSPAATC